MTDAKLLETAIAAAGLSQRRFATEVLGVDERAVRFWLASNRRDGTSKRQMNATVRLVCRAIVMRPKLAAELSAVREDFTPPEAD